MHLYVAFEFRDRGGADWQRPPRGILPVRRNQEEQPRQRACLPHGGYRTSFTTIAGSVLAGRRISNWVPAGSLSALTVPPCFSAMRLTNANPSPQPVVLFSVFDAR